VEDAFGERQKTDATSDPFYLDADILIDLKRGLPAALAWLSSPAAYPAVSGIAVMELTFGSQNRSELRDVQELLLSQSFCHKRPNTDEEKKENPDLLCNSKPQIWLRDNKLWKFDS
jgi:hypothetical protein